MKDYQCVVWSDVKDEPRKLEYWELFVYEPEYGLSNIVGCIPPNCWEGMRLYANDILYLMCNVVGLPGTKPAYRVVQPIADDKYQRLLKWHGKKLRQQYDHFAYGWLDDDFILSQLILADFGLEFDLDELQLILYWYWS